LVDLPFPVVIADEPAVMMVVMVMVTRHSCSCRLCP
ncbi:MAG: hypothetical protein K0S78_6145, partial [Thermomicrobiales bacterium]|nr:hypothetical protein [Thermomicrobiales bacterium]